MKKFQQGFTLIELMIVVAHRDFGGGCDPGVSRLHTASPSLRGVHECRRDEDRGRGVCTE